MAKLKTGDAKGFKREKNDKLSGVTWIFIEVNFGLLD